MAKKEKIGYQPLETASTRDIDAWFIILMTVLFFPLGVYLMWTRTSWKKWIKITVTSVIAALFLIRLAASVVEQNISSPADETTAAVEASVEEAYIRDTV